VRNLLRGLVSRHALFIALCLLLLGGFEFLICGLVATVDVSGILKEVTKAAPALLQGLLTEQVFYGMTTRGILAFGWNHPMALALGAAVAIVLAARAVAGEIENGTMELLLSQPIARQSYLFAHILFALLCLAVLSCFGALGTYLGQKYYGLALFESRPLRQLALNFFLLNAAWYGVALVLSVFARESGRVTGAAFLLALLSYVVQMLGKMWPAAGLLLPYSIYNYYAPAEILIQEASTAKALAVLGSVLVCSLGFSLWRFQRRDIP